MQKLLELFQAPRPQEMILMENDLAEDGFSLKSKSTQTLFLD